MTSVGCARSGFVSRFSFFSISGRIHFSTPGRCPSRLQNAQSIDSGAHGSFFLSSSDRRANAARVFEQSNGPITVEVNGS